ncbi:MAG: AlkA N-terminal domain-containing protein, partial [Gemmatimonadales bacterium]
MNGHAEVVRLEYRPPYDWPRMLRFLAARSVKGVESVANDAYVRTIRLADRSGWMVVRNAPAENALLVEVSESLAPALPALVHRLHHLFDLGARPDIISAHLARDARLGAAV